MGFWNFEESFRFERSIQRIFLLPLYISSKHFTSSSERNIPSTAIHMSLMFVLSLSTIQSIIWIMTPISDIVILSAALEVMWKLIVGKGFRSLQNIFAEFREMEKLCNQETRAGSVSMKIWHFNFSLKSGTEYILFISPRYIIHSVI
jgi:hypothetical protein